MQRRKGAEGWRGIRRILYCGGWDSAGEQSVAEYSGERGQPSKRWKLGRGGCGMIGTGDCGA